MFWIFSPIQLYRLTWWSRYSQEPRIDLTSPQVTSAALNSDLSPDSESLPDSWWRRAFLWLCGLTGSSSSYVSPVTENSELNSLQEQRIWRNICNVNALLVLIVNVFLWGYWA